MNSKRSHISEHILDAAFNKDKLGVDKTKDEKAVDDQHTSGSMTDTVTATETVPLNGSLAAGETHEFADSEQNHMTNKETFDTVFPGNYTSDNWKPTLFVTLANALFIGSKEHDRKYKHKNNAHKYKGWKERGYKIVTETEFVDRGRKVDQGFKKHINGSKDHTKEHSAGDVTKADLRKYHKNVKNLNKNYETLYGKQSPEKSEKANQANDANLGTHGTHGNQFPSMCSKLIELYIEQTYTEPQNRLTLFSSLRFCSSK